MCNDYEQHVAWAEYCKMLQQLELGMPTQQSELDLPQADDVRIGDIGPVMRAAGNGVELAPMTFGFPPSGPRGGPVFNFRSEGRRFDKSNRCLIPGSAFFEFTGTRYPKAKHRFTLVDAPFMAIAGLWRETGGNNVPAFTMLTTEPGEDVKPYHDRQIVAAARALGLLALPDNAGGRAAPSLAGRLPRHRNRAPGKRLDGHGSIAAGRWREPPDATPVTT